MTQTDEATRSLPTQNPDTPEGTGDPQPSDWKTKLPFFGTGKTAAVTYQPFPAKLPMVDLLPPKAKERSEVRRVRRRATSIGVGILGVTALLWVAQSANIMYAEHQYDSAVAEGVTLQNQIVALAPIKALYTGISAAEGALNSAMAQEVLTSAVHQAVGAAAAGSTGVETTSVTLSNPSADSAAGAGTTTATAGACPSTDPFQPTPMIGCVTVTGNAPNRAAVSAMLTKLAANPLFVSPFVSSSTSDPKKGITYTLQVGLTQKALSGAYLTAGAAPVVPAPAPAQPVTPDPLTAE